MIALTYRPSEGAPLVHLLMQTGWFLLKRMLAPFLLFLLVSAGSAIALAGNLDTGNSHHVRQALLTQFSHWEGTPYQYGGNSRHGIDCSGFVHMIYQRALGIEVPRSTELLANMRHKVSRRHLQAGDIILFRIDRHTLHAGIYVGNGQFIHASKSRGVMRSNLNNPYWHDVFSKAVRIIGETA